MNNTYERKISPQSDYAYGQRRAAGISLATAIRTVLGQDPVPALAPKTSLLHFAQYELLLKIKKARENNDRL